MAFAKILVKTKYLKIKMRLTALKIAYSMDYIKILIVLITAKFMENTYIMKIVEMNVILKNLC